MDSNLLKAVMRRYATGVMVLTVRDGGGFHAVTVNSVTSVSLDPPLLLVCLEKNARSHALVKASGKFALNILAADQIELGKKFAYDREARNAPQAQGAHRLSAQGSLLFERGLGWLECRVTAAYPGGDHTIFLAEVVTAETTPAAAEPLLYYESQWLGLGV